jgi:hypothetical protein
MDFKLFKKYCYHCTKIYTPTIMDFFNNAKEKLADLSSDFIQKMEDEIGDPLKEYGLEKMNDVWDAINDSSAAFATAGYSITEISMNLVLPPTIGINFNKISDPTLEQENKVLAIHKDHKILYSILLALIKANKMEKGLNTGTYKFWGLHIRLGLKIPSIEMKFKKHFNIDLDIESEDK